MLTKISSVSRMPRLGSPPDKSLLISIILSIPTTGHTQQVTKVWSQLLEHAFVYEFTIICLFSGTDTNLKAEPTELKINYEKLKIEEKMLFYDDVVLYEDELDDNGCSKLSVKMRVMPSGFFILLRFYLRVDKTLVRVHDTRIYHEVENDFLIREYSEREEKFDKLDLPRETLLSQDAIVNHLPVKVTINEKLIF